MTTKWSSNQIWPLALFLLFLAASPGRIIAFDVAIRADVAHALWSRFSPFVAESSPNAGGMIAIPELGRTSFYGIGQSLLFIPFDFVGSQLARLAALFGETRIPWAEMPIVWWYTPLVGVLWWGALAAALGECGLSLGARRRFAAIFLLSSIAGVYAATTAQEEAVVGALVLGAWVAMIRWCREGKDRDGVWVGLLLGGALLFRLNCVFAFLPIAGYAIDRRPPVLRALRGVCAAAIGALPALAIFAIFSHWRYGEWFATGYDRAVHQGLGVQWTSVRPALAWAMLFGGGKGILWLSPPTWLAAIGLARLLPKRPHFVIGTALAFLLASLLCSRIVFNPDGSECWSVRYLVHLLGFLAYPSWLGAQWLAARARKIVRAIFVFGFALQALSVFAPDTLEYQQSDRLGNHRYALIENWTDGQLALRVKNVVSFALHRRVAEPRSPEIDRVQQVYVPNLWGTAYPRKLGGGKIELVSGFVIGLLWLAIGLAGSALVTIGCLPRRTLREARRRPTEKISLARAG